MCPRFIAKYPGCQPKVYDALKEVFCKEASSIVVGWLWDTCLDHTIRAILFQKVSPIQTSNSDGGVDFPYWYLPIRILVFVLAVLSATAFERCIRSYTEKDSFQASILIAGLMCVPKWGFKACVIILIDVMTNATALDAAGQCAIATVIAVVTALFLQLVLPAKDPDQGYCKDAFGQIAASLGLGVGFAFNDIFVKMAGTSWSSTDYQVLYMPVILYVVSRVQPLCKDVLKDVEMRVCKNFLNLIIQVATFWAAWAMQAFLLAAFLGPTTRFENFTNIAKQIFHAFFVSYLAVLVSANGGPRPIWALLFAMFGVIVGTAWIDVTSWIYGICINANDTLIIYLLKMWGLTLAASIVVPFVAWLLLHLFDAMQACITATQEADEIEGGDEAYVELQMKEAEKNTGQDGDFEEDEDGSEDEDEGGSKCSIQ